MDDYLRVVSPKELEVILSTGKVPMSFNSDWTPYSSNEVVFLFYRKCLAFDVVHSLIKTYFEDGLEFVGIICFRAKLDNVEPDNSAFSWPNSVVHTGEVDLSQANSVKIYKISPQQFFSAPIF